MRPRGRRRAPVSGTRRRRSRSGAAPTRATAGRRPQTARVGQRARPRAAPSRARDSLGASRSGAAAAAGRRRAAALDARGRADADRQDDRPRDPRDPRMARPGAGDERQDRPAARHDRQRRERSGASSCSTRPAARARPSQSWTPLAGCYTWAGARRTAAWLAEGASPSKKGLADADFWYAAAAKLLAPVLFAAAVSRPHDGGRRHVDRHAGRGAVLEILDTLNRRRAAHGIPPSRTPMRTHSRRR